LGRAGARSRAQHVTIPQACGSLQTTLHDPPPQITPLHAIPSWHWTCEEPAFASTRPHELPPTQVMLHWAMVIGPPASWPPVQVTSPQAFPSWQ
jgi:hypothetical protein